MFLLSLKVPKKAKYFIEQPLKTAEECRLAHIMQPGDYVSVICYLLGKSTTAAYNRKQFKQFEKRLMIMLKRVIDVFQATLFISP